MLSRRLRGIASLAAVWGTALSALSTSTLLIGLATGYVPREIFPPFVIAAVALRGFIVGAISGSAFAWFLSTRERNRSVSTMSLKRAALWGFAAAAGVSAILSVAAFTAAGVLLPLPIVAVSIGIAGVGGGLFGAGLLRVAKRPANDLLAAPTDEARRIR